MARGTCQIKLSVFSLACCSSIRIFWLGSDFLFPTHHPSRTRLSFHTAYPQQQPPRIAKFPKINAHLSDKQWQEEKARVSAERAAARRILLQRVRNRIAQRLAYRSVPPCNALPDARRAFDAIAALFISSLGSFRALDASTFEVWTESLCATCHFCLQAHEILECERCQQNSRFAKYRNQLLLNLQRCEC